MENRKFCVFTWVWTTGAGAGAGAGTRLGAACCTGAEGLACCGLGCWGLGAATLCCWGLGAAGLGAAGLWAAGLGCETCRCWKETWDWEEKVRLEADDDDVAATDATDAAKPFEADPPDDPNELPVKSITSYLLRFISPCAATSARNAENIWE